MLFVYSMDLKLNFLFLDLRIEIFDDEDKENEELDEEIVNLFQFVDIYNLIKFYMFKLNLADFFKEFFQDNIFFLNFNLV